MYRVYEVFEVLPDGSAATRTVVSGLEGARATLEALSKRTTNECIAADRKTHQIVAQLNVPRAKRTTKRIFQISYDEEGGVRRAELLRDQGYGVIAVLGNGAAKLLLGSVQNYDLFIVGDAAPEARRKEMVDWLKTKYPRVKVLALNPQNQQIANADYNATHNAPESWLPFVTAELEDNSAERRMAQCSVRGGH